MKTTNHIPMKTNHALCGLIPGLLSRALITPLLAITAMFAAPSAARAGLILYVSPGNGSGSQTIDKVSSTGVVSTFATLSAGSTPLAGLAFDTAGNLYVAVDAYANQNNNRIDKVTPGGVVSTFVPLPFGSNPLGMAFDSSGNLYVAINGNPTNNTIDKITPGGSVSLFATLAPSNNPIGLAFDVSGNLYVSGNNGSYTTSTIDKITPGGSVSVFASMPGTSAPAGLVFDSSGNLYVADGFNKVEKITPGGAVSTFATLAAGSGAIGLAIDGIGDIYVAESGLNKIIEITPDGLTTTDFATGISVPAFLAFGPVPEPGTALFGIACVGVAALRRRRAAAV